jgi:RNA recognition motif-containing protein
MNQLFLKFIELLKGRYSVSYYTACKKYDRLFFESRYKPVFDEDFYLYFKTLFIHKWKFVHCRTHEPILFDFMVPFGISETQLLKIIHTPMLISIQARQDVFKGFGFEVIWKGTESRKIFILHNNTYIAGLRIFDSFQTLSSELQIFFQNLASAPVDFLEHFVIENASGQLLIYDPETFFPRIAIMYYERSEEEHYKSIFNYWMAADLKNVSQNHLVFN